MAPPTDVAFGDSVRIRSTPTTRQLGYADRTGQVWGETTPSVTGIDVIGGVAGNAAINVHFEDPTVTDAWFAPDLVELVDHGAGTVITVGDRSMIRTADGEWEPIAKERTIDGC